MNIRFSKTILFLLISLMPSILLGQETQDKERKPMVGLNSELTYQLMEPNQNLRKLEILIDAKSDGRIAEKSLNFGFSIIGVANYQHSNRDSKFAYLMRHPTPINQIGNNVSEIVIHSSQLSIVGSLNNWLTAYGELLYFPGQSFGSGTITSLQRNLIELRKGIILIGNLGKFPFYFGLGKMDILFGQMGSVSPFTNSSMWHAFGPLAYSGVLGFKKYGFSASLTAIQGGAQFRAANVPVNSTTVPSRVNNFAADSSYTIDFGRKSFLKGGLSYLKGSAYGQSFPVGHFVQCSITNPAYTYYGELSVLNKLLIQGSFAKTLKEWPGTHNPNPPLNIFPASKVSSLNVGAKYQIYGSDKIKYALSAEFSDIKPGPENSPWERQSQIVLGLNAQIENTSRIFIELFRTAGYAPGNFISGGNLADLGETHSDRNARSFGIVVGLLLSL